MIRFLTRQFFPLLAIFFITQPSPALAQSRCVDYRAIGGVIDSYYRIISGPSGDRDWAEFGSLLLETARFDAVGVNEKRENQFFPQTRDEYMKHVTEYVKSRGFFQKEINRSTRCFARIAHVFSTHESRNEAGGGVIDRAVMSFQLINQSGRWQIAHVMWNSETKQYPILKETPRRRR